MALGVIIAMLSFSLSGRYESCTPNNKEQETVPLLSIRRDGNLQMHQLNKEQTQKYSFQSMWQITAPHVNF